MFAALLFPSVANVANTNGCVQINSSTVQVKLTSGGPNYDIFIGGIPIIPHKYWAAPCSWPVGTPEPAQSVLLASQCAGVTYDPMAAGIMVGDGPYACIGVAGSANPGAVGGSCSQNADGSAGGQVVSLGGRVALTENALFERGPAGLQDSKYQKFTWADKFGAGLVNIADLADAALHFKHYDPYWAHPSYSSTLTGTSSCPAAGDPAGLNCVDIGVIATIASYIGIGAVAPVSLSASTGLDPRFNLFGTGAGGCFGLGTSVTSSTTVDVSLVTGASNNCPGGWSLEVTATTTTTTVTTYGGIVLSTSNGRTVIRFTVSATTTNTNYEYEFTCVTANGTVLHWELHIHT